MLGNKSKNEPRGLLVGSWSPNTLEVKFLPASATWEALPEHKTKQQKTKTSKKTNKTKTQKQTKSPKARLSSSKSQLLTPSELTIKP